MTKLLFVCHGNICRSPMAEFTMKDLVRKAGLESQFHIESAATSREEIGNPVYPPARRELEKHGILCSEKYAALLQPSDYDHYDWLLAMDAHNLRHMISCFRGDPKKKCHLLMEFSGTHALDIADPWYTGDFQCTYQDIQKGCLGLFSFLMSQQSI